MRLHDSNYERNNRSLTNKVFATLLYNFGSLKEAHGSIESTIGKISTSNEVIVWGEIRRHRTLETTKKTRAKQQATGTSISGHAKSAPTLNVSRSDTAENPSKANIQGFGIFTL